jgi:AraC-like DNA-binding protein
MADWVENITDRCIISKGCRERFLPLDGDYAAPLVERGVNFIGVSDLRARYEIERRRPDFHVVILTLGGEGRYRVASGQGVLRPGDLWVIPAGEPQHYGTDGEWRILFFHIASRAPGGTIPFSRPTVIPSSFAAQLESAMTWYLSELLLGGPRSQEVALAYAHVIRICLDRALDASRHPERSRVRVRLDELWEAINGNIGRNWTVDEMARRVSLSVSQFRRVVVAQHGSTPQDMLVKMRIGRAQQLLVRTDDTLAVIADRVGYESPFSLSRAFRRACGVSPREYRKRAYPAGRHDGDERAAGTPAPAAPAPEARAGHARAPRVGEARPASRERSRRARSRGA